MDPTILVNFHSHSTFSDGEQTPEELAGNLALAGVRYAALTDHDTLEGLARFREALKKSGVGFIPGVEMTTYYQGREAHLLAYGFELNHQELNATLLSLRQNRNLDVHSISGSLRKLGASRVRDTDNSPAISAAPDGRLDMTVAIALIHRAGGRAFWAHPLQYDADPARLDALIGELKAQGLDGIEVIYSAYTPAEQETLRCLAQTHGLLISAGTDFHTRDSKRPGGHAFAIAMPRDAWSAFRQAVVNSPLPAIPDAEKKSFGAGLDSSAHSSVRHSRFERRSYIIRIFVPTLIAIALFLAAIWGVILPSFENTLLERKREMIHELTNSAWSILASYERDEKNGLLTQEQAQAMAITRIEALRYGSEGKDYFWIQDLQPRMIMHPYRKDLNGKELASFKDPRGVAIFVEFAQVVRREREGYIDYVWQWKDDPSRLRSKESFVKGFEPWNWIIGTGIYTDDVNTEIASIEKSLVNTSLIISSAIILLLIFVLQQSLRVEKERQEVVDNLHESTERYHTLIESTSEGTLLVLEDRCRYANATFLGMLGYTGRQLDFLELADLLPQDAGNEVTWDRFRQLREGRITSEGEAQEGCLRHADGHLVESVLTLNPISFAGQNGFILLVKDLARQATSTGKGLALTASAIPLGLFRARAARRGVFVEINQAGRALLQMRSVADVDQPALADLFSSSEDFDAIFQSLMKDGVLSHHLIQIETPDAAARFLDLSACLVRDERQQPAFIDGVLQDVTAARKQESGREMLVDRLQTSLLFLHEPIRNLGREVLICDMDTPIEQVARQMTERQTTAALIASASSAIIGIVTDRDLRSRVLSEQRPLDAPIHAIMSAPVTRIGENALIYEALMRMEERNVQHLAIEDQNSHIVSVIDHKSLIQFKNYGPIVLTREIARAATAQEAIRHCQRIPPLVKTLLDTSARPQPVLHMLATTCDALTERLIQFALEAMGPPPAAFAFIAMGSQGRQEQTLLTDQDNGIIYAPSTDQDPALLADYFLRLGTQVCDGLNQAGFPYCRGQVMASNPRWCRSLPEWIAGLDRWVHQPEPQEIIDANIFLDFRTVYGEAELTQALRRTMQGSVTQNSSFFHLIAENALTFKPPFRLLGNIYLSGGATEHAGEINLKDAMMPMVSFARLYALRHRINQTNTLERIGAMCERNLILASSRDEIIASYDFLMKLRLQTQCAAIQAGRPPNHIIHPAKLGYMQQESLKQAFAQIAAVQKKIGYDFLGGA